MNLTIRLCQPETDLPALTELVNAVQGTALTPEQVLKQLTWHGHDLARDRFVAVLDGRLVGMSMLFPQSTKRFFVNASVHPEFRRRGIGRALLERAVDESRQRGAQQVTGDSEASDTGVQAFAAACGFQPAGEVRFFTAPADLTLPDVLLPEGFSIRSAAEFGDTQIFADAANRCYQDMWGHHENLEPVTVEMIENWRRKYPNILQPGGMFVIFTPDGSPVGVTRADPSGEGEETVWVIDAPGVAPEYRSLGLQRVLVITAARWHRQKGSRPLRIETWGDTPEAVGVYESLGFQLDEASHSVEFVRYL